MASRRWLWSRVGRVWMISGLTATAIFVTWSLLAYRAQPEAKAALRGTDRVTVSAADGFWTFRPQQPASAGLLFFPGALVDPAAYALVAQRVAEAGHTVLLMQVPRRGAFGGADAPELLVRARRAMRETVGVSRWVVAGHSRGGEIACRFVFSSEDALAGLVLVGTSHPRDISLASTRMPVTRIVATNDTIADLEKVEATRHNLPAATRVVRIEGGNHSQFAHYGFQPGDWPATISRDRQQRLMLDAILAPLAAACPAPTCAP